jgi:hypothetical protein
MQESEGDPRYYLPAGVGIITPERASKGDVLTGPPCSNCAATGKVKSPLGPPAICRACRGKGWTGSVNAAGMGHEDIRFAQIHEVNLLNKLWDCEHITDQQHHDCQTFQIWRDMHRAQMGLEKPVSSGGEEAFGVRLRAYGYILLLRGLSRHDNDALETALTPLLMSWAEWIARNRLDKYVTVLERLSRILPPIKDRIAYLEGLSEEQREQLSQEGIKIMLADINFR